MWVNRDPEIERLRGRLRAAERACDRAVGALRKGPALTIAERERVLTAIEGDGVQAAGRLPAVERP